MIEIVILYIYFFFHAKSCHNDSSGICNFEDLWEYNGPYLHVQIKSIEF